MVKSGEITPVGPGSLTVIGGSIGETKVEMGEGRMKLCRKRVMSSVLDPV